MRLYKILRAVQRLDRGCLADRRGVGRGLGLDDNHRLDQFDRARAVAEPPAGHRIGLGDAVQRDRAVHQAGFDLHRGREFEIVINDVFVHVVGHHPDMGVAHQHVGQAFQLGTGIGRARRVAGRIQQHPLGLRRDRRLEVLGRDLETVGFDAGNENRRALGQQHHVGIGHPVRRGDDHLVARIERRHEGVIDNLLAAAADDHLLRLVVEVIVALELVADRLAQLQRAGDGRVFRLARVDRGLCRRLDIVRRIEIRLAGAEADDIASGRL